MLLGIKCPRCGNELGFELEGIGTFTQEDFCRDCGATVEVDFEITLKITRNDAIELPTAAFYCPICYHTNTIIDFIDDETGSVEFDCYGCNALLEVNWSSWGQDIEEVIVIDKRNDD